MTTETTTTTISTAPEPISYRPFSNGTEFDIWADRNCDRCQFQSDDLTCPGEEGIIFGLFGDGTITAQIADYIGTAERDDEGECCTLIRQCNHFQPRQPNAARPDPANTPNQ